MIGCKNKILEDGAMAETKTNATADILKALPENITPSILAKHYKHNDGGKIIRRHLRKHFATKNDHKHNDKWVWANDIKNKKLVEVIEYCQTKFTA